jgi:hypothetical protein
VSEAKGLQVEGVKPCYQSILAAWQNVPKRSTMRFFCRQPYWMPSKEEQARCQALLDALDDDDTPRWPGMPFSEAEFEYYRLRDQMDLRQARREW